jgi:hypothetical protein
VFTVTVKLPSVSLPAPSRVTQRTEVVPPGKRLPDFGVQATASCPETASVAVATNDTVAVPLASASTVIGPGTTSWGGVVSRTVIVNCGA